MSGSRAALQAAQRDAIEAHDVEPHPVSRHDSQFAPLREHAQHVGIPNIRSSAPMDTPSHAACRCPFQRAEQPVSSVVPLV